MSAAQTLVLTVLPNGVEKSGISRLSVLVTPKLSGGATLADFSDLLRWPELLAQHGLTLSLTAGGGSTDVAVATDHLRSDLWNEIFEPTTLVDPYPRPDFDKRLLVSYPHRTAHQFLRWGYTAAATRSISREGGLLLAILPELAFRDQHGSTLDATLEARRLTMWREQTDPVAPPPIIRASGVVGGPVQQPADTRVMAEKLALYHRLPPAPGRPPLPSTPAEFAQILDFHKVISSLSSYPALMRALGLILDVELADGVVPPSPGAVGSYGTIAIADITPGWTWSIGTRIVSPLTAYVHDAQQFRAAPAAQPSEVAAGDYAAADVINGFLAVGDADFELVNVETDGAMLKAMTLADNVMMASGANIEEVLPALRSGGLSLVADARAQEVLRSITDNSAFQQAEDAADALPRPLNARDIARGYRIDVWSSQDGQWHSLHRRDGAYRFGSSATTLYQTSDEEGFTQLGVVQPADDPTRPPDQASTDAGAPQPGTDLYVHERVARWHGWSLSAPRPGQPINRSADPAQAAEADPTEGDMPTPFKMKASFTVRAGSLPKLRFGARYRMRVRVVDLAGNSPSLQDDAPQGLVLPGSANTSYLRFEPVLPPVIALREPPAEGASLLNLAIRSYNASADLDYTACGAIDERHILPPKADVLTLEHHGCFDDAQGRLKGDAATYDLIVARDKGALPTVDGTPLIATAQVQAPWFPDPLAQGVALSGLPWTPDNSTGRIEHGTLVYDTLAGIEARAGSVTMIPFGGAWPAHRPFRLVLSEGRTQPAWDESEHALTVFLRKASVAEIPLSSFVSAGDLALLGVWDWMRQEFEADEEVAMQTGGDAVVATADRRGSLTRLALEGGHEMITPAQTISLTHAVQQPIGHPTWMLLPVTRAPSLPAVTAALRNKFAAISAWRSPGSHHAVLLGGLKIHGASTARIDIFARWTEWVDDLSKPAPSTSPAADHVETIELRSLEGGTLAADGSGSRDVASYIPSVDALWFAGPTDTLPGVMQPAEIAAPVHQFGDTRHRRVRYHAVAVSRFQEYFPEPGLDFTRTGNEILVSVPSSARPAAPDILYCVPTFGWERQESSNVKTEIRRGNGLRVYLDRPWYSSGEGELLGVVLWQEGVSYPTDKDRNTYKPYFSQWGIDPVWEAGATLSAIPSMWLFPEVAASASGLTLEETDLKVDVAGHRAQYDPVRSLWFCDILFSVGDVYAPFVRLALARYQPASIAGVELSHVVLADFAQLTADRSAALSIDPSDPTTGRLFVGGVAPSGPTTQLIVVTVEKRDPTIGGDLGWAQADYGDARAVEDIPGPGAPESALWSGQILFAKTPAAGQFRIVIREYELFPADAPAPDELIYLPFHAERLIYASIIPWTIAKP